MNDRRRLLWLSILVLTIAVVSSVVMAAYHFRAPASSGDPSAPEPFTKALLLSVANALVIAVAGGTLLVRISNPFMRRLEQSEGRTAAILNKAGDGIITVDERGLIETFNLASQRMFGYPAERARWRRIDHLISMPQALITASGYPFDAREFLEKMAGQEILGHRLDGTTFPLELSLSEMRWADHLMFTVIVRDVTERKAAEEQMRTHMTTLQEVKERLEAKAFELARINRELDDFTYVASHDLKEPLRGISSYCQILREDYADLLDEDGRRRLEALVGLCQRLGRLIDDLLTYSQIGRTQPLEEDADLNRLTADVLATLGPTIDERGAVVRVVSPLPVMPADATMVGEVLRNLIGNALKFNESDRPEVEIGSLDTNPPTIYVRDNGIGIAQQHHAAIFTMFRRLHSRRKYEGTGAGLTFVRKIVEAHGGRVWLQSEPGQGSTFYFTLSPSGSSAAHELAASVAG